MFSVWESSYAKLTALKCPWPWQGVKPVDTIGSPWCHIQGLTFINFQQRYLSDPTLAHLVLGLVANQINLCHKVHCWAVGEAGGTLPGSPWGTA